MKSAKRLLTNLLTACAAFVAATVQAEQVGATAISAATPAAPVVSATSTAPAAPSASFVPPATAVSSSADTQILPTSVKVSYKIYKGSILIGQNDETFERKGKRYSIVSTTHAEGPLAIFFKEHIIYKSEGVINAQGLQPLTFEQVRAEASRNIFAKFDWDKKEITSTRDGRSEPFDLPDGTQDRLSSMYQFMHAIPKTAQLTVLMSQGKRSERYSYQKQGEPTIKTPVGDFETVYYARNVKDGESKSQLWLAKNKFYLPVRVIFEDKNGAFEQVLTSLSVQ